MMTMRFSLLSLLISSANPFRIRRARLRKYAVKKGGASRKSHLGLLQSPRGEVAQPKSPGGDEFHDTQDWTEFYNTFDNIKEYFLRTQGKNFTSRLETVVRSGNLLVHATNDQLVPPYNMLSMSLFSIGDVLGTRRKYALFDLKKCKVYVAAFSMHSLWSAHWYLELPDLLNIPHDSEHLAAAAQEILDKTGKSPKWYPVPSVRVEMIRFNKNNWPSWKALFFRMLMKKVLKKVLSSHGVEDVHLTDHGKKLLSAKVTPEEAEVEAFNSEAINPPGAINGSAIRSALSADAGALATGSHATTQEEVMRKLFEDHQRALITELIVDARDDALIAIIDPADFAKVRLLQEPSQKTTHRPTQRSTHRHSKK